ncbi:hypothetical protein GIX45_16150 [Erwinia sp. CPCC 100877]|nr:hypothetical protein [Erwinia sp. CPCC 100877]
MKKSSPEQERENYTQQIIQKENQIDDLTNDKRKLEHVILDLDHDIQRGFQQLGDLNQEQARYGGSESLWQLQKNEEQLSFFKQTLREANEEYEYTFRNTTYQTQTPVSDSSYYDSVRTLTEQEKLDYVKEHYPDSYNFIESLKNNENEYTNYAN